MLSGARTVSGVAFVFGGGALAAALVIGVGLRHSVSSSQSVVRRVASRRLGEGAAVMSTSTQPPPAKNVLGSELGCCCTAPVTGFYRDGYCKTGPMDTGRHVVCAIVTDAFLHFTKSRGNDLSTPRPDYGFPGLKDGSKWCLCAIRWREAMEAGVAPPVILSCTNEKVLEYIDIEDLKAHAIPG